MQAHAKLPEYSAEPKNFRIVLTGAPCSGKTTTIEALKARLTKVDGKDIYLDSAGNSYQFVDEVATQYIHAEQKAGLNPFSNMIKFEQTVMAKQVEQEDLKQAANFTILDRSMLDNLAITEMREIGKKEHIDIAGAMAQSSRTRHYDLVFILDRLPFKKTSDRIETDDSEAVKQDEFIRRTYANFKNECGYHVTSVPVAPVNERVDFILNQISVFNALYRTSLQKTTPSTLMTKWGLFSNTAIKSPAQKTTADLMMELDAINTKIELQSTSIKACSRGIIPPQLGQSILDFYISEKAEIEKQIEALNSNNAQTIVAFKR